MDYLVFIHPVRSELLKIIFYIRPDLIVLSIKKFTCSAYTCISV